jgi:hypothetical protein
LADFLADFWMVGMGLRDIVYHCRSTAHQHMIAKAQHRHFNKLVIETH